MPQGKWSHDQKQLPGNGRRRRKPEGPPAKPLDPGQFLTTEPGGRQQASRDRRRRSKRDVQSRREGKDKENEK